MINLVALGLLLSYIGTVVVLVPEPHLTRANQYVLLQEQEQTPEKFPAAQQAVSSLLNAAGTTESKPPSKIEQIKQKVYQGFGKTAEGVGSVKDSAKDVYEKAQQGAQEKAREAYSSIPSKDEAASYIPGKDQTRDALETLKTKLENSQQGISDAAASGKDSSAEALNALKDQLENSRRGMQESIRDAISSIPGRDSDREPDFTENVGEVFDGVKERLSAAEEQKNKKVSWFRRKPQAEGGLLAGRVQEFCGWFVDGSFGGKDTGGGGGGQQVSGDAKESYRYLMDAAKGSIDGAREVFEKAVVMGAGGGVEWRERYNYLAGSAKGALEGARDVFERVAAGSGSSVVNRMKEIASETNKRRAGDEATMEEWAAERAGGNVTAVGARLKQAAEHTKERLTANLLALLRSLYLAIFSVVYGTTLWMTFVSGHLLALALPRQQLGSLQSKLFPVYLRSESLGIALCFVIHAFLHPWPSADHPERWQYGNFAFSLAACLLNTYYVEPKATKAMFERLKVEKEEGTVEVEEHMLSCLRRLLPSAS